MGNVKSFTKYLIGSTHIGWAIMDSKCLQQPWPLCHHCPLTCLLVPSHVSLRSYNCAEQHMWHGVGGLSVKSLSMAQQIWDMGLAMLFPLNPPIKIYCGAQKPPPQCGLPQVTRDIKSDPPYIEPGQAMLPQGSCLYCRTQIG